MEPSQSFERAQGLGLGFQDTEAVSRPQPYDVNNRTGFSSPTSPFVMSEWPSHQPFLSVQEEERLGLRSPSPLLSSGKYRTFHTRIDANLDSMWTDKSGSKHKSRPGHCSYTSLGLIVLASYSVLFSGIWLCIALAKSHYSFIMAGGKLNSASTLIAAVAKTIELSFIAVFIGFLGQYLSRNALDKGSKGISIADMQLRTLILQPATLFTHWHGFHFGGRILLGCVSLVACVSAMLFTTASDTLGML